MKGTAQYWIFGTALAVLFFGLALALVRSDRDARSKFSFVQLLIDPVTGKTSPARVVLIGAFLATTFVLIYQAFIHTLTDATFGAYMLGWVTPAVTKIITDGSVAKAAAAPDQTTQIGKQINMTAGDNSGKETT